VYRRRQVEQDSVTYRRSTGAVTASQPWAGRRIAAFVPAAVGLLLFVAMAQIRMQEPWADGVLLVVAAAPALLLLAMGLAADRGDDAPRAAMTVLLVGGLVLAAVAIGRLGDILAGDDFLSGGGTLTWMLAVFTALAAFLTSRTRSVACLLITALAAVGLLFEAVNWIFDTEDIDVFRVLVTIAFAVLLGAGLLVPGRAGTVLVGAAGVVVLVGAYFMSGLLALGENAGWGWELVALLEGVALLAYAARRLEPGPGYLAFFVLAFFVTTAAAGATEAGVIIDGEEADTPERSLVGWPLALAIATVVAGLWAARQARRQA
jgi:hypothetical protein